MSKQNPADFVLGKRIVSKQSLNDIMNDMPSLKDEGVSAEDAETKVVKVEVASEDQGFGYSENIPHYVARALLGRNYDPNCYYKMLTQRDSTVVVKVDPRVDAHVPPTLDSHGNVVRAHMLEYMLEEEPRSYADTASVGALEQKPIPNTEFIPRKKSGWIFGLIAFCVVAVLLWFILIVGIKIMGGFN